MRQDINLDPKGFLDRLVSFFLKNKLIVLLLVLGTGLGVRFAGMPPGRVLHALRYAGLNVAISVAVALGVAACGGAEACRPTGGPAAQGQGGARGPAAAPAPAPRRRPAPRAAAASCRSLPTPA